MQLCKDYKLSSLSWLRHGSEPPYFSHAFRKQLLWELLFLRPFGRILESGEIPKLEPRWRGERLPLCRRRGPTWVWEKPRSQEVVALGGSPRPLLPGLAVFGLSFTPLLSVIFFSLQVLPYLPSPASLHHTHDGVLELEPSSPDSKLHALLANPICGQTGVLLSSKCSSNSLISSDLHHPQQHFVFWLDLLAIGRITL